MSNGRRVWSTYATFCRLPEAVRGWSDITAPYVKRFGQPKAGERIFIRTQQMINGWKDKLKETSAVVPEPEAEGS